jgi:predicted porin
MNQKLLAIAIAGALVVPMAAQAVSFKVSGQVNRNIQFTDDGIDSDVRQTDNTQSGSRFRMSGSEDLGIGGMKVGFNMEVALSSNNSSAHTMKGIAQTDSTSTIRQNFIWFSGNFGRIDMGHTDIAFNGSALNTSLSGTPVFLGGVGFDTDGLQAGGTVFRTSGGGSTGTTIAQAHQGFHGTRLDTLKYTTPTIGPFSAAISVEENEQWSFRANLAGSFSGARYRLGGGMRDFENQGNATHWGLSGAVRFSQGTSMMVTYSERDGNAASNTKAGVTDAETFYIQLAHAWGNNGIGIDYVETDDAVQANYEYSSWGVAFTHSIPGPRVQLFAGYRNHDLDRTGANVEDIDQFNVGARVQFWELLQTCFRCTRSSERVNREN